MKDLEKDLVLMPGIEPVREDYKTNLAYYRNLKHYSQNELSKASGVNAQMIKFYEQGVKDINKAQANILHKLAKVLKCDIEDLLELQEGKEK